MDLLKFYDITHRDHVFCNPMSIAKIRELIARLRLKPDDRVLDIGTGKGEFLIRLAEQYDIKGIGIDLSPYHIADAIQKHKQRIANARLTFIEMDAADYKPEAPESFNVAACIGACWIYGGYKETLMALNEMVASGGWLIVGEPWWRREPSAEYLKAIDVKRSDFAAHVDHMKIGQALGFKLVYTLVSNQDDWDRYEGLQWSAAHEWADSNPDDADVKEVLNRVSENQEHYLRWGRETLGWAIYVFRK